MRCKSKEDTEIEVKGVTKLDRLEAQETNRCVDGMFRRFRAEENWQYLPAPPAISFIFAPIRNSGS